MAVSAVRGATQAEANTAEAIYGATEELLRALIALNDIRPEEIVAAFFTMSPDLDAGYPAFAARRLGWSDVPLLGAVETDVPGSPARTIRVLVQIERAARERLRPVYLRGAASLRPDIARPE